MADAYIDEAFVEDHLGSAYVNAAQAVTAIDLTVIIEGATGVVQGAMQNAGYSTPTTTTDQRVKLAVLGCVREMVADIPEAAQPLPENWASHIMNPVRFFDSIVDGKLPLSGHTVSIPGAVGGWQSTTRTGTYGRPPRASRTELKGR